MKLTRVVFGAIVSIHTGVAPAASWTQTGPGLTGSVAGINHLVIDGTGSTLYAVGNGLFRSTDGGATWKLLSVTGVQVVALDPTSASTIYAGARSGVLKSTDAGESWNSAGLAGQNVTILAVDPITPSTLYATAGDGNVYKSNDGGQSWTAYAVGFPSSPPGPSPSPTTSVSALLVDPATPSTLYVISSGLIGSQLYKSTDGAQTWTVINPGPVIRLLAIDPATTPSTLYAIVAGFTRGFSKSMDGGATWTKLGLDLDIVSVAVDPRNSNVIYAGASAPFGSPPVIYKSTDGGQAWNAINSAMPLTSSLVVSPVNSAAVYATTNPFLLPGTGGIFKSTDAGMTWNQSSNGLRVFGAQVLEGDPIDPATMYAAGDEGIFKSADRGVSWNRLAAFQIACCNVPAGLPPGVPGFPALAPASVHSLFIDFANTNILYAGIARAGGCFFTDILLFKSTDGGANWSNSINPDQSGCVDGGLVGMDPTDPHTLYLRWGDDFDGFGLNKSTDGGVTWSNTALGANELNAFAIDPSTPANLYAATDGGVAGSTDGGATWNQLGLANMNVSLLAIDPLQPNILYATATAIYPDTPGFLGLLQSTDRGATWSPINSGLQNLIDSHAQVNGFVVNPVNTNVLYLATTGYGVFKSSDAGATWVPYNDGLRFLDVRALGINRGDPATVYAGTLGGVFQIAEDTAPPAARPLNGLHNK